jgi:pimeloyl-ACP methyl ester carboxylesterase
MPIASVNGVRLHFLVLDPVRPARNNGNVVLVHGLGGTLGCWYWKLAPELARSNRVVMFDLRGHGLSSMPSTGYTAQVMATDVLALLDYLGVADAHFLGHSLGGRIIVHLACLDPRRVKSIILADVRLKLVESVVAALGRSSQLFSADHSAGTSGFRDEPVAVLEKLARRRLRTPHAPTGGPFSGIAGRRSALQWLHLLNSTTARDDMVQCSDPPVELLAQLSAPTLLAYGERSPAMQTATALTQLWPHARLNIVPGANHFFPVVQPDRLLSAVNSFFRTGTDRHVWPDPSLGAVSDER